MKSLANLEIPGHNPRHSGPSLETINGRKKLLLIGDDSRLRSQWRWSLDGYTILTANDRASALAEFRRYEPPVVLHNLDLSPDPRGASKGLAVIQEILAIAPYTKIIVIMRHNDRQDAAKVVGLGVYEVCSKPIDANALALTVQRAFQMYELEQENVRITRSHGADVLDGIIATDNRMLQVCRLVEKAAVTDTTVLLLGESGTGKELLARATHTLSSRKNQRFVAISCAAIPETLLESELYGYEKGAFTGALKQMPGKIETAHGGTLFLDEIGDMPLALQAKLLRFLQERVVERVGGRQEISVDVRVVCATNQNLHDLMRKGRFREDLFYRISEVTVSVPPVRERGGDAIILARAFLEKCAKNRRQRIHGFSRDALEAIQTYHWPGNVRELENKIQGAVILAEGKYITAKDLGLDGGNGTLMLNLRRVREQAERQAVVQALTMDNGNISKAAMLLGVSRPTLYDLLHKHGLR